MTAVIGFIGFVLLSGAILAPIVLGGSSQNLDLLDGVWAVQVALSTVYGLAMLMLLAKIGRRSLWRVVRASMLPIAFFVLTLVSAYWSVMPELSFRRAAALGGVVSFAIFLLHTLGYERTVRVAALGLVFATLASVVFIAVVPSLGIHSGDVHAGNWKGVFLHKNLLGREMALAAGIFLALATVEPRRGWRRCWVASTALAVILVVGSRSATGILTMVVLIALMGFLATTFRRNWVGVLNLVVLLPAGLLTLVFFERIAGWVLHLVGRDSTITGRDTLWHYLLQEIAARPFLGHGYQAFWGSGQGFDLSMAIGWRIVHAHNGLLEILLSLGLIGLALVFAIVISPWITIVRWRRLASPLMIRFGAVITVGTILVSVTDSVLLGPNNLFFALLIFQAIACKHMAMLVPDTTLASIRRSPVAHRSSRTGVAGQSSP